MEQTKVLRNKLVLLLENLHIKSFLDAPCGDLNWMRYLDYHFENYIGIDIVEDIIQLNINRFEQDKKTFKCRDICKDILPKVDMIFCRDTLVHLNFNDALMALKNFKNTGSTYLVTTTFTNIQTNKNLIGKDIWRALNLEKEPFCFPAPMALINENCTEGNNQFNDKSLALWKLEDILL